MFASLVFIHFSFLVFFCFFPSLHLFVYTTLPPLGPKRSPREDGAFGKERTILRCIQEDSYINVKFLTLTELIKVIKAYPNKSSFFFPTVIIMIFAQAIFSIYTYYIFRVNRFRFTLHRKT